MEYDLIFISSILIIILICLYVKKCKNKQIEPFLFGSRTNNKGNKFAKMLANRLGKKPQCPKCPDCNCPSIQISKTVSSDTQLQKLLDVYVREGLDKIIEKQNFKVSDIKDDKEANTYLSKIKYELGYVLNELSEYTNNATSIIDEIAFVNGSTQIGEPEKIINRVDAIDEISSVYFNTVLLKYLIKEMGFGKASPFFGNVRTMPTS